MNMLATRRDFLAKVGVLGAGAALASTLNRPALAADDCPAWLATCRDSILKHLGQKDCWATLEAVGAEGIEAQVSDDLALPGLFHPTMGYSAATAAGIEAVARDAKSVGKRITALCMFNRFDSRPDVEVELCRKTADAAQALGIPAIRIDVVPEKSSRDAFLKLAIDAIRKVMAATEATGVKFAIENHGTITNDPEFLTALFDGVGSNRLGLTLDTGNFYWFGHPLSKVYEAFEKFAPRVFHTHCKSIRYPADQREKQRPMGWKYAEYGTSIDQGDLDFAKIVALLRKAGYHGDLCIEDEFLGKQTPPEAVATLTKEIQLLKKVRAENKP